MGENAARVEPALRWRDVTTDGLRLFAGMASCNHVKGQFFGHKGKIATIAFAPVNARFVRITQTATVPDAPPWSLRLLRLYEAAR